MDKEITNKNYISYFRTKHYFEKYVEINTLDDFKKILNLKKNIKSIYILGNGSNTFFVKKKIKSLIIKNNLPKTFKELEGNKITVSSSCKVQEILRYCEKRKLNSFYYLSSVPATIGGAIAMNAGRGRKHNKTILDYVMSVTFIDKTGSIKTIPKSDLNQEYRKTIFSENFIGFIISVEFQFSERLVEENPIKKRIIWAKDNQDYIKGNCGSIFKDANFSILRIFMGMKIFRARFSKKTINWIINESEQTLGIILLIILIKITHLILFQKAKLEIRCVK